MKQTITLFGLIFLLGFNSFSQENKGGLLKFDLGIINKLRLAYEKPVGNSLGFGAAINTYYGSYSGIKIEPFARLYFGGKAPEGLYLQGRFLYGNFKSTFTHYASGYLNSNGGNFLRSIEKEVSFSSAGVGGDLGYQWLSGRKSNIVIDLSLGIQAMQGYNDSFTQNGITYSSANVGFNVLGPGAIFNPHLLIGYRF
jgi:hypothetical protein